MNSPAAEVVAAQAPARLQAFDLSGGRALSLIRAAREVARGRVDLEDPDHGRGWRRLRAIPGIGSWTVEMLALTGQGRLDQIPAGDLGLPEARRAPAHRRSAPARDRGGGARAVRAVRALAGARGCVRATCRPGDFAAARLTPERVRRSSLVSSSDSIAIAVAVVALLGTLAQAALSVYGPPRLQSRAAARALLETYREPLLDSRLRAPGPPPQHPPKPVRRGLPARPAAGGQAGGGAADDPVRVRAVPRLARDHPSRHPAAAAGVGRADAQGPGAAGGHHGNVPDQ